jgi:hypothetical protein
VTIVPLDDVPTFLRDSLAIVRRGVATARSLNQSNPALGIMADLPDKVDYEIMVVSSSQSLNRQTSMLSNDNGIELSNVVELSGDRDSELNSSLESQIEGSRDGDSELRVEVSGSSDISTGIKSGRESSLTQDINNDVSGDNSIEISGDSSLEGERSLAGKIDASTESSKENNNKTGTSIRTSSESARDGSNGTSNSNETDKTDGVGIAGSTDNDLKRITQTATTNSTDKKIEKSNTTQKGSTAEWNTHTVRGFDQSTGRWGGQSFAPVNPPTQTLKCS